MPPAPPASLVALRVRGAAGTFPGTWRRMSHRLHVRAICHVGLSPLSASPKSHFSPSPLPSASPGGRPGAIVRSRFVGVGPLWADEAVSTCSARNHLRRKYPKRTAESPCTCLVRESRAGADHIAIRDRVEDRPRGRVGDVRDGSRIRLHQDARETRSSAPGAELRGS
jgi:hypothetical protein